MKKSIILSLAVLMLGSLNVCVQAMDVPMTEAIDPALHQERLYLKQLKTNNPSKTFDRNTLNQMLLDARTHEIFAVERGSTFSEGTENHTAWKRMRKEFERIGNIAYNQLLLLNQAQAAEAAAATGLSYPQIPVPMEP